MCSHYIENAWNCRPTTPTNIVASIRWDNMINYTSLLFILQNMKDIGPTTSEELSSQSQVGCTIERTDKLKNNRMQGIKIIWIVDFLFCKWSCNLWLTFAINTAVSMTDLICFNHPHDSKPVKNELIDGFLISHTVIQENKIFRNRQ